MIINDHDSTVFQQKQFESNSPERNSMLSKSIRSNFDEIFGSAEMQHNSGEFKINCICLCVPLKWLCFVNKIQITMFHVEWCAHMAAVRLKINSVQCVSKILIKCLFSSSSYFRLAPAGPGTCYYYYFWWTNTCMFLNSLGKAGLYYVFLSLILLIGILRVYSARADAEIHRNKKNTHTQYKETFFTHAQCPPKDRIRYSTKSFWCWRYLTVCISHGGSSSVSAWTNMNKFSIKIFEAGGQSPALKRIRGMCARRSLFVPLR